MNFKQLTITSLVSLSLLSNVCMQALTQEEFKRLPDHKKCEAYELQKTELVRAQKEKNEFRWGTFGGGIAAGVIIVFMLAMAAPSGSNQISGASTARLDL